MPRNQPDDELEDEDDPGTTGLTHVLQGRFFVTFAVKIGAKFSGDMAIAAAWHFGSTGNID